ncbi:hypothetical protein Tdes44962_MAKER00159 [Teratosphaeria destructans]|uniref:Uncharacterized protein n=1 Tax=Teratosphaeria destructans TaxID=418781 RepID=A0A9W7W405_9PEZI|nr:hypothetical protein Tdes44962_MAKER00159 [Teratosphaeria destructans]
MKSANGDYRQRSYNVQRWLAYTDDTFLRWREATRWATHAAWDELNAAKINGAEEEVSLRIAGERVQGTSRGSFGDVV